MAGDACPRIKPRDEAPPPYARVPFRSARAFQPDSIPRPRHQQGGACPFEQVTVDPGGTTTVVLRGGGGSLLLKLRQPPSESSGNTKSRRVTRIRCILANEGANEIGA